MTHSELPIRPSASTEQISEVRSYLKSMLRRAYAHAKGLGALLGLTGSFVAIMAIYTYLSAIDRLDLFLPSISIGPGLFIWLFFVILLCIAFLLCIATPSALFGMLLTIFGLSDEDLRDCAPELAMLTVGGFFLFCLAVLFIPSTHFGLTTIGLYILSFISVMCITAATPERRRKYLKKIRSQSKWYPVKAVMFGILISSILVVVVLTGIFPALFTTWSHTELNSDSDDYFMMLLSFCSMALSCTPVLIFYVSRGALLSRLSKGLMAVFGVLVVFVLISPSIFKVITYSAASAATLRDTNVSEYIVSKKYPASTFEHDIWHVRNLNDEEKRISIQAFPLFKFGDTLLLCPAEYVSTKRAKIPLYSKRCFPTSSSEMTVAAPNTQKPAFYLRESYCGHIVTKPPFPIARAQKCVFAPPILTQLLITK